MESLSRDIQKKHNESASLKSLKEYIQSNKLGEKYLLTHYEFSKRPFSKNLHVKINCPRPLFSLATQESKMAIGNNGLPLPKEYVELWSHLGPLPSLKSKKDPEKFIPRLLKVMDSLSLENQRKIKKLDITKAGQLSLNINLSGQPLTILMGKTSWKDKSDRLNRLMAHFSKEGRIPKILNLSTKKVVVKY